MKKISILIVCKDEEVKEQIKTFLKPVEGSKISIALRDSLKKEYFDDKEVIVSVGGDGTFLSCAHNIDEQLLLLGVNSNPKKSEGALTSIMIWDLQEKLNEIVNDFDFLTIKEYTRERVRVCKKDKCVITEHALNETYMGNINPHHPSNYEIVYNDVTEKQRSSGVLVTTGTGSSAWYYAMGGRKFSREKQQLRFRIRELFKSRLYKPTLEKGKIHQEEVLEIVNKTHHSILAIDSIISYNLDYNDRVLIEIGKPLSVII